MVRVHESGDFYSQEYLEKWKQIWRLTPDVKYLAFTKSFHLDFIGIPKNVSIYNSVDETTKLEPLKIFPLAVTIETRTGPKEYHFCGPVGKDEKGNKSEEHYNYCGSKCLYCWDTMKNVAWLKH